MGIVADFNFESLDGIQGLHHLLILLCAFVAKHLIDEASGIGATFVQLLDKGLNGLTLGHKGGVGFLDLLELRLDRLRCLIS